MKFVLINWSYNETGRWISISSTDFETTRQVAEMCLAFVQSYRRIRYDKFSKAGGLAMIEGIETRPEDSDINGFLSSHFRSEGWKADRRANFSFSKTT